MNKSTKTIRAYADDIERINRLAREVSLVEDSRVGAPEVLRRTLNIPKIKDTLMFDAEAKRNLKSSNRRGGVGIWGLIAMAFVLVALMLVWFVISVIGPPITFLVNDMTGAVIVAAGNNTVGGDHNFSDAASVSLNSLNQTVGVSQWAGYTFIGISLIVFLVFAFQVRTYPFLLGIWVLFILILAFTSLFITSAYIDLASGNVANQYSTWANSDYIMRHLPIIITFEGILGGIIMFTLVSRDPEAEGSNL